MIKQPAIQELPRLESSSIMPAAANDASTATLVLDTNHQSYMVVIDESSARDLLYELQVFLGEEEC